MAAEPMQVPVPLCETCWLIDHTRWEPESMNSAGQILMRLTGVDVPEKVNTESVEVCGLCGSITVAGIYDMYDPAAVDYIRKEDESLEEDSTHFILNMSDFEEEEDDIDE